MRILRSLGLFGLALGTFAGPSRAGESDFDGACLELLEKGEQLTSTLDEDIYALGVEKLRDAARVCGSREVSPELRARALLLTTRLYTGDRELQLQMRSEALTLLRVEAPDSRLLPEALEAVADTRMVMGQFDEGLSLSLQALAERERLFGDESREYVRGLIWTSVAYKSAAREGEVDPALATALRYSEQAVELATRNFGSRDPATIAASIDLVDTLRRLRRFDEAEALQERIAPYVDLAESFG
jgi:hypothetical protein